MAAYTLADIRKEYDRLDSLCGVDTRSITIKISTRSTDRYGYCKYKRENGKLAPDTISITDFILKCENEFWNTIRHEYAHALVTIRTGKKHGHDHVWQDAAKEVGCKPDRLASDKTAAKMSYQRRSERTKYEIHCRKCGRIYKYMRAGGVVRAMQAGRNCTCACGSSALFLITR